MSYSQDRVSLYVLLYCHDTRNPEALRHDNSTSQNVWARPKAAGSILAKGCSSSGVLRALGLKFQGLASLNYFEGCRGL